MDIKLLLQKMHDAETDSEKESIKGEIENRFNLLNDEDKKKVQQDFMQSLDNKLNEAEETLKKVDVYLEMKELSAYLNFAQIAKEYFGKSKEWLYQRINGFVVNGKPAQFNEQDKEKLSSALIDLSQKLQKTALRIID
jgi:hypothetical protein